MFDNKKSSLITPKADSKNKTGAKAATTKQSVKGASSFGTTNAFVGQGMKKSSEVRSGNGAKKYSTSGNIFVDQFGQAGNFKKPRKFAEISTAMTELWAFSANITLRFLFYLRMVTRVVSLPDGSKTSQTQRGQGLKHEGIFRMMWVSVNYPKLFWKNIPLFISVGSWKDIFTMLSYDLQYNGWDDRKLDWDGFGNLILAGLENPNSSELIKKYLPQIKTNSRCKTVESQADNMIAKWICSLLFGGKIEENNGNTYKKYRKLKTSGTAHQWQQLISQKKLLSIDFSTVHGRALAQLVTGKFLKNNNLEKAYEKWLEKQPTVKYTGYPYELLATIPEAKSAIKKDTIIKQFKTLIETAKDNAKEGTSLIVVRDTSGSMSSAATGTKISCFNVAKALALFFSELLPTGHFANSFIEFNSDAKMHQWKGKDVVEKWNNDSCGYYGSTDFQSVIRLFCKIKATKVPESEFPTGILCISDGEFNPAHLGKTNVQAALDKLKSAGFSKKYIDNFQIILWNVGNNHYGKTSGNKFETVGDVKNVFYFSGLDGSVVTFLTGMKGKEDKAPTTPAELFDAAMDQEVLDLIQD